MPRWEVRTREGAVTVEGGNWLLALGAALPALDLDADVLSRLVCDVQSDGVVRIIDPSSRRPMLVRQLADAVRGDGARAVVPVGVVAGANSPELADEAEAPDEEDDVEVDATAPPPPVLSMPRAAVAPGEAPPPPRVDSITPTFAADVPASQPADFKADDLATLDEIDLTELTEDAASVHPAERPAPPDLAEDLFIASSRIADATDVQEAATATLAVLNDFVAAEAGAVLYATINDTSLRFLAATGPAADEVADLSVPLGTGLAGFCFDTGAALIIRNAGQDPRHRAEVDEQTGYRTGDMLTVALKDNDGGIHGCIQLLNPPTGFAAWHLEAATTLGLTLADYIRVRA